MKNSAFKLKFVAKFITVNRIST